MVGFFGVFWGGMEVGFFFGCVVEFFGGCVVYGGCGGCGEVPWCVWWSVVEFFVWAVVVCGVVFCGGSGDVFVMRSLGVLYFAVFCAVFIFVALTFQKFHE